VLRAGSIISVCAFLISGVSGIFLFLRKGSNAA
jgi:hypothetical protein